MRQAPGFWWFLFVPYFWVKSLNSRPFFGQDAEFANRVNGLIALALIFTFVILGAINVTSSRYLLKSTAFDVCVYTVGFVIAVLVVNRKREQQYSALYEAMPRSKRRVYGFAVLALFVLALAAALMRPDDKSAAIGGPLCPTSARQTTAECSSAPEALAKHLPHDPLVDP